MADTAESCYALIVDSLVLYVLFPAQRLASFVNTGPTISTDSLSGATATVPAHLQRLPRSVISQAKIFDCALVNWIGPCALNELRGGYATDPRDKLARAIAHLDCGRLDSGQDRL
jgi:hypothetical protein